MTTKINKRLTKDLYIFLNDLSKNMFDCDDYDSLPNKQKEGIYKMVTELRKQILLQIYNIKNK